MLWLIDSTPIPLGKLCAWAKSNGRIRGMKLHVVYDPRADCPRILDITDANINDAQIGRTVTIEMGATYVFDKGYCGVRSTSPRPTASRCSRTARSSSPARAIPSCRSACAG